MLTIFPAAPKWFRGAMVHRYHLLCMVHGTSKLILPSRCLRGVMYNKSAQSIFTSQLTCLAFTLYGSSKRRGANKFDSWFLGFEIGAVESMVMMATDRGWNYIYSNGGHNDYQSTWPILSIALKALKGPKGYGSNQTFCSIKLTFSFLALCDTQAAQREAGR